MISIFCWGCTVLYAVHFEYSMYVCYLCYFYIDIFCHVLFDTGSRKDKSVAENNNNNNVSEDFHNQMASSNVNTINTNTGPAYNVLNGNVVETTHFYTSNQRIYSRRSRILDKTADLRQFELDKAKTYVYSHAVRY